MPRKRRTAHVLAWVAAVVVAAGATVGLSALLVVQGIEPWLAASVSAFALMGWAVALSLAAPRWLPRSLRAAPGRVRSRRSPSGPRRPLPTGGARVASASGPRPPSASRRPGGRFAMAPALLWTACLVVGLLLPLRITEALTLLPGPGVTHAAVFALFTWLWVRVYPRHLLVVALLAVAIAVATELAQLLLPVLGRGASPIDFLANAGGIGLGLLPGLIGRMRRRAPRPVDRPRRSVSARSTPREARRY